MLLAHRDTHARRDTNADPQQLQQQTPHRCCWLPNCSCSGCPQKSACPQPPKPLPQSAQNASTKEPMDLVSCTHICCVICCVKVGGTVQRSTRPHLPQCNVEHCFQGLLGSLLFIHNEGTLAGPISACIPLMPLSVDPGCRWLVRTWCLVTCVDLWPACCWLCAGARTRPPRHGSDATVECWHQGPA